MAISEADLEKFADLAEAVIISGPRKGEFILVDEDKIMSAAPIEALMEQLLAAADALNKTVDAQTLQINHLQNEAAELRRRLSETHERLIRSEAEYEAEKRSRSDRFLRASPSDNSSSPKKGN